MPTVTLVNVNTGQVLGTVVVAVGYNTFSHPGYSDATAYVASDMTVGLVPKFGIL